MSATSQGSSQLHEVPCLVLVGGLGTRLRPVVNDLPKPMAPIAGRPFLEYLVRWLGRAGVRQITLCAGYRADKIQEYFQSGDAFGVRITYSIEAEPLGTWGAIRQAAKDLRNGNFLALNGDSWLQVDLQQLFNFHLRAGGAATIAAADVRDASRFGSIQVDSRGKVLRFAEKQAQDSALVNGGIYAFSQAALSVGAPPIGSLENEVFPRLIARGIYAMPVTGYFVDIGIPTEYERLRKDADNWIGKLGFAVTDQTTC